MKILQLHTLSKAKQHALSILLVLSVSSVCFAFSSILDYRVIAFFLLLTVSLIAVTFDIIPVLVAAGSSAVIWNYFFIPPRFTFHIDRTEDIVLFVMYFLIALINSVLTHKIRKLENQERKKEEKANTLKLYNTILNSLSHELRTPISTIIGAVDNLQSNELNLDERNKKVLLSEISKASDRLNHQVENLLNMSRLESGFIHPKMDWCDLNEIIYEMVNKAEENRISQNIVVNVDPHLPLFRLDKVMLEQVIYNLLNNAIQYSFRNSTIHVTVIHYANVLEIVIEDNGPGFPAHDAQRIFDKFYRLKNSRTGGTGLGLSIVKGFAEAMGGSVKAENMKTGGAAFTVSIPAETTQIHNRQEQWLRRKF
jgi:two-component system sensor histidine kinase KdpD